MNEYKPTVEILLEGEANRNNADLTFSERMKDKTFRVIGGDKGDLRFTGYTVEDGFTSLDNPVLVTVIDDLSEEEINEISKEILDFAFDSIGFDCVQ